METEVSKGIMKLTFGKGNAKLDKSILTFSLPAGYTCPGAKECLSRANIETGRIEDGPHTKFRCFAASQEATYAVVRESRWMNFGLLKAAQDKGGWQAMATLIMESLPPKFDKVRIHVSGDFFSAAYFQAWIYVAMQHPDKVFYAYTKSLNFWASHKHLIPANLILTASRGGKFDDIIEAEGFTDVEVIFHPDDANGKPIDHDDSLAYTAENRQSFALLVHGAQPAGSEASKAISRMKKENIQHGYSAK